MNRSFNLLRWDRERLPLDALYFFGFANNRGGRCRTGNAHWLELGFEHARSVVVTTGLVCFRGLVLLDKFSGNAPQGKHAIGQCPQRGDVVGFAATSPSDVDGDFLEAFIWTKENGMQPLGFLPGDVHSEAYGINEKRQVVGLSCDANGNCRAFIWENGTMTDLNALKPASYTATLEQARDINEAGEIATQKLAQLK